MLTPHNIMLQFLSPSLSTDLHIWNLSSCVAAGWRTSIQLNSIDLALAFSTKEGVAGFHSNRSVANLSIGDEDKSVSIAGNVGEELIWQCDSLPSQSPN